MRHRLRHRLYLQLYVALLASAFVCLAVAGIAFRSLRNAAGPPAERVQQAARVLAESLTDVHAPEASARVRAVADAFAVDIVAGDADGALLGFPGPNAFAVPRHHGGGFRGDRIGLVSMTSLEGDGWAALRPRGPYRQLRTHPFFTTLAVLALVMAIGSYPVARRVARRLETLAGGVERWGQGDLRTRVPVEGNDEIARLAETFNRASERVEVLLGQQKAMLANASHELRSPLARLRMGLELCAEEPDEARRQGLARQMHGDIVELDGLIEEMLLFARADARVPRRPPERVELGALLVEEAARTGASVDAGGGKAAIDGDRGMLRHLMRNLLENARLHGGGDGVHAAVTSDGARVVLTIDDRGPGVPEDDRERIFAPFYRRPSPDGAAPAGHGLGLALVRQVARYHGGDVACRSRPDGGSRFEVTLPVQAPTDQTAPALSSVV